MITHAEVLEKLSARKSVLNGMWSDMLRDEEMYHWSAQWQDDNLSGILSDLPPGFKPTKPPLAYLGVQVGVNSVVAGDRPDVLVEFSKDAYPRAKDGSETKEGKRKRRAMQEWDGAFLKHVATHKTESPFKELIHKMLALGLGGLSYALDYGAVEEPPHGYMPDGKTPKRGETAEERVAYDRWKQTADEAFLWDVYAPHPTWIAFDVDNDPPRDFIIEQEISSERAAQLYPDAGILPGNAQAKVKRVEYVSATEYGCWIDGKAVTKGGGDDGVVTNTVGRPWVRIAWGGHGDINATADWSMRGKGLLRDGKDIIIQLIRRMNQMDAMGMAYAFPGMDISGGSQRERDALMAKMRTGPGVMNDHTGDITIKAMEVPQPPAIIATLYQMAQEVYSAHFGVDALRGSFHDEAASKYRARKNAAELPYGAAKVNAEQLTAAMISDVHHMVKYELMRPITIDGVTLKPDDIVDGATITVDFTPITDEEKAFKQTQLDAWLKAGAITLAEYIEQSRDIEDGEKYAADVRVEKAIDALLQGALQAVQPAYNQQVMQQLGIAPPPPAPAPDPNAAQPAAPMQPNIPPDQGIPVPEPTAGSPQEAMAYAQRVSGAPLMPGVPA